MAIKKSKSRRANRGKSQKGGYPMPASESSSSKSSRSKSSRSKSTRSNKPKLE